MYMSQVIALWEITWEGESNLGGGKQKATDWHVAALEMSKAINEVKKLIYEF
jgi:hypothetical protein